MLLWEGMMMVIIYDHGGGVLLLTLIWVALASASVVALFLELDNIMEVFFFFINLREIQS